MVDSAKRTASKPIEVVAYVDDDDQSYDSNFQDIKIIRGRRIVLSNMWNKCAEAATGNIFCQANDDIVFKTHGWNTIVEDGLAQWRDGIGMVHGTDESDGASGHGGFAVHPFVTRRWYETLGYLTAPFYSSDCGDTHINELANAIGRRAFLPNLVIEHLHYAWGKAEIDQTTSDRLTRHSADNVDQLYRDLAVLREIDIEKLKARMKP